LIVDNDSAFRMAAPPMGSPTKSAKAKLRSSIQSPAAKLQPSLAPMVTSRAHHHRAANVVGVGGVNLGLDTGDPNRMQKRSKRSADASGRAPAFSFAMLFV